MKCSEIKKKLDALGIPVAYHHFNKPQKPPFIAYFVTGDDIHGADDLNLIDDRSYRIELYTDHKNEDIETEIFSIFSDRDISVSEVYIPDQQLYMVVFELSTVIKLTGRKP